MSMPAETGKKGVHRSELTWVRVRVRGIRPILDEKFMDPLFRCGRDFLRCWMPCASSINFQSSDHHDGGTRERSEGARISFNENNYELVTVAKGAAPLTAEALERRCGPNVVREWELDEVEAWRLAPAALVYLLSLHAVVVSTTVTWPRHLSAGLPSRGILRTQKRGGEHAPVEAPRRTLGRRCAGSGRGRSQFSPFRAWSGGAR